MIRTILRIIIFIAFLFVLKPCVHWLAYYFWSQSSNPTIKVIDKVEDLAEQNEQNTDNPQIIKKNPLYWDWKSIDTDNISFPDNFFWGVASSAHQIEGHCDNNDWSLWEKKHALAPTGIACDHCNNIKQDVKLLKEAGINCYSFSIEWSKIEPNPGTFNNEALQFYKDLCKELKQNGIKPIVTLFHHTSPIWFAQLKGFEKIENIQHFINYAQKVFMQLLPFVDTWITFNAPTSYVARAYYKKLAPPGVENMQLMQEVLRNMLNAHVQTYQALKNSAGKNNIKIGLTHNIYQIEPHNSGDQMAADIARELFDTNIYTFFTTGTFKASVPFKAYVKYINKDAPTSLDFIGLNYYSHGLMRNYNVTAHPHEETTLDDLYTVYPEGFYRAIRDLDRSLAKPLNIPIYITENGIATNDENQRTEFYKKYIFALSHALKNGCNVAGYITWSFMDCYEWGTYDKPYGIYKVDFTTQKRTLRQGSKYYLNIIKQFSK